tara:strand:+ start:61 stop:861 length:801 start_codon:yes stop_codon:yes gene_type:complete
MKISDLRLTIIFLVIITLTVSCNNNTDQTIIDKKIEAKNFELKQNKDNGDINWKLISSNAKYLGTEQSITADKPIVDFFTDSNPQYRITSKTLQIKDNGEQIIMNNNILVTQLRGQKLTIEADKLVWKTQNNTFKLSGNVVINRYMYKPSLNPEIDLKLTTDNLSWNNNTGLIQAYTPIKGIVRPNDNLGYTKIDSESLSGNTKEGLISLIKCEVTNEKNLNSNSEVCRIYWSQSNINIGDNYIDKYKLIELVSVNEVVRTIINID